MENWAVFTGDIVKSSKMSRAELDAVFAGLADAAQAISDWQDAPARLTRFRGDGWQMAVRPDLSFRAALAVRAAVRHAGKGFDTRIGIGIGAGAIPADDLSGADGPAFVRAGHALDTMKRTTRMFAPDAPLALRVALLLADQIAGGWTPRQAEIGFLLLPPAGPTHAEVAEKLGLTRQTIQIQAENAGFPALFDVCDIVEDQNSR
tara:strand:+ start:154847 stop:155461 length:615 start_codon:yes stop_codon:yes gene_type:complete